MADQMKITDGPSKLELMLALFDKPGGNHRTVTFTVDGQECVAQVLSVEAEDGSRESWNIRIAFNDPDIAKLRLDGYYRTDKRKGLLVMP